MSFNPGGPGPTAFHGPVLALLDQAGIDPARAEADGNGSYLLPAGDEGLIRFRPSAAATGMSLWDWDREYYRRGAAGEPGPYRVRRGRGVPEAGLLAVLAEAMTGTEMIDALRRAGIRAGLHNSVNDVSRVAGSLAGGLTFMACPHGTTSTRIQPDAPLPELMDVAVVPAGRQPDGPPFWETAAGDCYVFTRLRAPEALDALRGMHRRDRVDVRELYQRGDRVIWRDSRKHPAGPLLGVVESAGYAANTGEPLVGIRWNRPEAPGNSYRAGQWGNLENISRPSTRRRLPLAVAYYRSRGRRA